VETARPLIEQRRQELRVRLPEGSIRLQADPVRLAQIIANLLTNASKYSDPETVIELAAEQSGPEVVVSVRDQGEGIAPGMLERIFDMFVQESSTTHRESGLGVGLALVKGLVELHGGTVEARSPGRNKGSEFRLRLPVGRGVTPPAGQPSVDAAAGNNRMRRVLIADDNRDAAQTLALLLQMGGHQVTVAHDGDEALRLATRDRPEVVVLDIGMPKLNGYEVASRLRAEPWSGKLTLVAVTGWGQAEDRKRALESGFDQHFTKPIDPKALLQLMAGDSRR
jgi:CheY-like chemotaxis protein/anti-sigma regulatory factor (Ser/Thr protein kinase)